MQSKEDINLSKRASRKISDLTIAFRDKDIPEKRKGTNKDICYNCQKFWYFRRDCFFYDRRVNSNTQQSQSEESQRKRRQYKDRSKGRSDASNKEYQTSENKTKYDNNSDIMPFVSGPVGSTFMVRNQELQKL